MQRSPVRFLVVILLPLFFMGCDGEPVTQRSSPPPGAKDGETIPPTPGRGSRADPLPPASAPVLPSDSPADRGHPAASPAVTTPATLPPPSTTVNSQTDEPSTVVVPEHTADKLAGTPVAVAPAIPRRDDAITAEVYRTLAGEPGLSIEGHLVIITTTAGTVKLNGRVADDDERAQIVKVVGQVEGVCRVEDRLAVQRP